LDHPGPTPELWVYGAISISPITRSRHRLLVLVTNRLSDSRPASAIAVPRPENNVLLVCSCNIPSSTGDLNLKQEGEIRFDSKVGAASATRHKTIVLILTRANTRASVSANLRRWCTMLFIAGRSERCHGTREWTRSVASSKNSHVTTGQPTSARFLALHLVAAGARMQCPNFTPHDYSSQSVAVDPCANLLETRLARAIAVPAELLLRVGT
jgi:hypothetical protein